MSGPRLVVAPLPAAETACVLDGAEAAHARARRLRQGDSVVLVDGTGREALAHVTRVTARKLELWVDSVSPAAEDGLAPIRLAVSAIRAERLAWIAEKATEFGAARITIVTSDRTQRFRAGEALSVRLERVVREAAKQAERARWPEIRGPLALAELLSAEEAPSRFVLDSRGEPFPAALESVPTAILVGPEGGWTASDLGAALESGWSVVSLAAGTLRAETAAVAALALARSALSRGARASDLFR